MMSNNKKGTCVDTVIYKLLDLSFSMNLKA